MTEKYLHYLWGSRQFPIVNTELTNGDSIVVKSVGEYNENLKGPDFRMGAVKFGDIVEYGAIEIHVKGSDWYVHKHHLDKNYDNVILHVVYEDDKPVIQNGRQLPTLELKDFIRIRYRKQRDENALFNQVYPCLGMISSIDTFHLNRMKDLAFIQKMRCKINQLDGLELKSREERFYALCAVSFGMKVNQHLFIEFLEELPLHLMLSLKKKGVLAQFIISLMEKLQGSINWNTKGTRPSSFPNNRISQFIRFVECEGFERLNETIVRLSENEILEQFQSFCENIGLPNSFIYHLSINVLAPFLWWESEVSDDTECQDKAVGVLSLLPLEKNRELSKMPSTFRGSNNAYDSQGLIALNRYYCSRKKCLSCDVGNKVLNRL